MSDLIRLNYGQQPWKPTPDSKVVIEYQYYDVPLSGVIAQGGSEYQFTCLDGAGGSVSFWWYTSISAEQRAWIESAPTTDEFHQRLRNTDSGGWSRLALVAERQGILDFEDLNDDDQDIRRAVKALVHRLDSLTDEAHDRELSRA